MDINMDKEIVDYIVVSVENRDPEGLELLVAKVNSHIHDGWTPLGGVSLALGYIPEAYCGRVSQAMVKYL